MKSRKSLIIILLILTIGLVGLTIAYFANSTSVDNVFTTQPYGTTVTEEFTSPSNWLPGEEVDKTIVATNTGNVDEAVRISLSENWKTANNGTLNGWITENGNKSSHLESNEPSTDERVAVINFDNDDDWYYSNGYYYYKYKLSPNASTSSLIKSVTFNSKTKLDDTCVETSTATGKTITCNSSGEDYDDATYTLTFTIETLQYNKYKEAWNTNVNIASMKPMNATQLALKSNPVSVTNYTDGNVHEMYTFEHAATEQTPALTDYRYIGNDPYNYVYFNCDDLNNQNSETCEVWRIIGVFDVERTDPNDNTQTITERRMKLVRGSLLSTDMSWDTNEDNDWNEASLKEYLNGDYYNNLFLSSKNMINDVKYYLGAGSYGSGNYGSAEKIYTWERGTEVYSGRLTSWEGKVALIYPSDMYMTYSNKVNETCYSDPYNCNDRETKSGWLYNSNTYSVNSIYSTTIWLLSPTSDYSNYAFQTNVSGKLNSPLYYSFETRLIWSIRPTLYLSSSVKIIDGDGSINNPYKLSL